MQRVVIVPYTAYARGLNPAIFRTGGYVSKYAVRTFYSKNTFALSDQGQELRIESQAAYIERFSRQIGQNAGLIRHIEIPFQLYPNEIQTHRPYPASLDVIQSSYTRLNTLTFRFSKCGGLKASNNKAAFDDAIPILEEHLQQRPLVKITCIIDAEFMLPGMKDKMTECGWTVVVDDTERMISL